MAGSLRFMSFARLPLPEAGPHFVCTQVFGVSHIPIRFSMTDTLMFVLEAAVGIFVLMFNLALLFMHR